VVLPVTDAGREQTRRARNRALVAVLIALVALFYAITIVRVRASSMDAQPAAGNAPPESADRGL
jgi:predicted metal-binding membrane protein